MIGAVVAPLQQLERIWIDGAGRHAPALKAREPGTADALEQTLGDDAAGRVSRAEEEHVVLVSLRWIVVLHS